MTNIKWKDALSSQFLSEHAVVSCTRAMSWTNALIHQSSVCWLCTLEYVRCSADDELHQWCHWPLFIDHSPGQSRITMRHTLVSKHGYQPDEVWRCEENSLHTKWVSHTMLIELFSVTWVCVILYMYKNSWPGSFTLSDSLPLLLLLQG